MAELADAAHAAAEHGAETTAQEYITHHLSYLTFGQPDGHWGFAHTMEEATEMGFMAFHVDTYSGPCFSAEAHCCFSAGSAKSHRTPPMACKTLSKAYSNSWMSESPKALIINPVIAPLALTVFVWILLMNLMDLVPVDWLPEVAIFIGHFFGQEHMSFKVVPTTDPNITLGMSFSIFALIIYYSIKNKGAWGFFSELAFHPFGKWMMPFNLMIEIPTR